MYRNKVLNSLINRYSVLDNNAVDMDVTDAEWFVLNSMTQSFASGDGLPGLVMLSNQPVWISGRAQMSASHSERSRQGQGFGLQKMVCISSRDAVVELGSTKLIFQSSNLVNEVRVLFDFNSSQPDLASMIGDQRARGDSDCSEAKCKTTEISLTLEVVEEQFGKTMKEAAKNLDDN
ncbi:putative transcription factor MYC/MYB [Helianthus debilis subsp. tardiflorus]